MKFENEDIKVRLTVIPMEYGADYRPLDSMVYQNLDQEHKGRKIFDLWERMDPRSESWLGVLDDEGAVVVEGTFKTYLHTGSYQDLMKTGMQIGREEPAMKDFFFVYLNSPLEVEEKDLKTKLFLDKTLVNLLKRAKIKAQVRSHCLNLGFSARSEGQLSKF